MFIITHGRHLSPEQVSTASFQKYNKKQYLEIIEIIKSIESCCEGHYYYIQKFNLEKWAQPLGEYTHARIQSLRVWKKSKT